MPSSAFPIRQYIVLKAPAVPYTVNEPCSWCSYCSKFFTRVTRTISGS